MTEPAVPALRELHGVGPKLEKTLHKLGVQSVHDLLFHLPYRYEDRTRIHPIGACYPGARVLLEGTVEHSAIVRARRSMLVVILEDGSGRITLRFFHFRAAQARQLSRGTRLRCYGEVRPGYQGLEMVHPSYQRLPETGDVPVSDRLTPVYPSSDGLGQATWIRLTDQALALLTEGKLALEELLPPAAPAELGLPELAEAVHYIHRPPAGADVAALVERRHPMQMRLALEELTAHNLSMQQLHLQRQKRRAPPLTTEGELEDRFLRALPFTLTGAQQRVVEEIQRDLARPGPMQRLVQGDVGSGKTVVAALAALRTIGSGFQVALTAPTELLAEQHLRSFDSWLRPLGIEPAWLSSKVTGKRREKTLSDIAAGTPLVIGTHALMQEGVDFSKLGLVIVDEQHRFGVHQRMALLEKSGADELQPHQLIMTATPIPRTLAMTAYAGLQTSVIDELPPGRKPVTTVAISDERRREVIERIASACAEGRQAYWVCTLIEESDAIEAQAAEDVARELASALPGVSVGLVHGRLKAAQKQEVMDRFLSGEVQLLVATTVIEVGVDVPNASLMIIENSERLGLAQLHQLRGRVGRGSAQSSCVLLYSSPIGSLARQRLNIMRESNDGFRIAEKDLELRGPGEVLGTRQTGMLQFRVADLARDQELLDRVPGLATQILSEGGDTARKLIERWIGPAARFVSV